MIAYGCVWVDAVLTCLLIGLQRPISSSAGNSRTSKPNDRLPWLERPSFRRRLRRADLRQLTRIGRAREAVSGRRSAAASEGRWILGSEETELVTEGQDLSPASKL